MSRYDHKIETSLEGIEHLSKENKEEIEKVINKKISLEEIEWEKDKRSLTCPTSMWSRDWRNPWK